MYLVNKPLALFGYQNLTRFEDLYDPDIKEFVSEDMENPL